ncbi:hypothetical protein [Rothia terrae]|uniref:hypothetical protein n=1 Tax=Rothia terrae TaxID=396015 RepID=UPI002881F155|nr:hypothetical protein [Rothia terrae]MDT0190753.1 hypothetical protein [Rothia terrae]
MTALVFVLFAAFVGAMVWGWSAIAGRDPAEVFTAWIPSIIISLICLLIACLRPSQKTGKQRR